MRLLKPALLFVACVTVVLACTSSLKARRGVSLESQAWSVPVDVANSSAPSQQDWYELGWQTFVALNWPAVAPASANRGQPDTTQPIGASSGSALLPTVWLTYRSADDTMLAKGADPGAWNSPMVTPPTGCKALPQGAVAPGFQPMILDMTAKSSQGLITGNPSVNEATDNPLVDQEGRYVLYDIRLNQSEYTYIQQNGYYDAAKQIAAFQPPNSGIADFPRTGSESTFNPPLPGYAQFGALELKAAWRVLDPNQDVLSRYYTQVGYFIQPDGTCEGPVTFGLVGLHILRLTPTTPATWYWASFEQVDNTSVPSTSIQRPNGQPLTPSLAQPNTPNGNCTTAYNRAPAEVTGNIPWTNTNAAVNVCRVTNIPSDVAATNAAWQQQLQGTVWAFYELVTTINPSVKGGPSYGFPNNTTATVNTNDMSNTSMETYSQGPGNSCMACHSYATPQGAPQPITSANQIFTFLLSNAASSQ